MPPKKSHPTGRLAECTGTLECTGATPKSCGVHWCLQSVPGFFYSGIPRISSCHVSSSICLRIFLFSLVGFKGNRFHSVTCFHFSQGSLNQIKVIACGFRSDRKHRSRVQQLSDVLARASRQAHGSSGLPARRFRGKTSASQDESLHHPRNPGRMDDSPVNIKKQWFPIHSKWCRILSIHRRSFAENPLAQLLKLY